MTIDEYLKLTPHAKRQILKFKLREEIPEERHELANILIDNELHMLDRFLMEVNKLWKAGRRHYAARTIIEVMRHNSAIQSTDEVYKIPNWMPPIMARLSLVCFPQLTFNGQPFFSLRGDSKEEDHYEG